MLSVCRLLILQPKLIRAACGPRDGHNTVMSMQSSISHQPGCNAILQWRSQPKNWGGGKMLDFRRATVFCLRYRLSKHKTSRYATNLVGFMAPFIPLATPMVCSKQTQELSIVKGRKSWRRKLNGVSLLNDIAVLTDIIWKLQKWAVTACPLFGKIERKCTKLQMQKRQNQSAAGSNH